MKNIVLYIKNNVYLEAISNAFKKQGDCRVTALTNFEPRLVKEEIVFANADVLIMDISLSEGNTLVDKLKIVNSVKEKLSKIKIAVLCDTTMSSTVAEEVIFAKQTGGIDIFFFESVTSDYLVASVCAL